MKEMSNGIKQWQENVGGFWVKNLGDDEGG
jgi:hypothetical protein